MNAKFSCLVMLVLLTTVVAECPASQSGAEPSVRQSVSAGAGSATAAIPVPEPLSLLVLGLAMSFIGRILQRRWSSSHGTLPPSRPANGSPRLLPYGGLGNLPQLAGHGSKA